MSSGNLGKWSTPGFLLPRRGGKGDAGVSVRGAAAADQRRRWDYRRIDIVAVIEREGGIRLRPKTRRGEYCGRCPFPGCSSREDGFLVWDRSELDERADGTREKHFWCRRCGRSGDVVRFIKELAEARGLLISWQEAARRAGLLALDAGEREGDAGEASQQGERRARACARASIGLDEDVMALLAVYERAKKALLEGEDDQGRAYLAWRGIDLDLARRQGIGYLPWGTNRAESELRQRWRGRILFPLYDSQGRVTGFKGRSLAFWESCVTPEEQRRALDEWNREHPGKQIAAYLACGTGSFGTPDISEASSLICCEGEFDALAFLAAGISSPVRATGKHPAGYLPLTVVQVTLALDRDVSQEEARALGRELRRAGLDVKVVMPPAPFKDFADAWQAAQAQAQAQGQSGAGEPEPEPEPEGERASVMTPASSSPPERSVSSEPEPEPEPEPALPPGLPEHLLRLARAWPGGGGDLEIEYQGRVVWRESESESESRGDAKAEGQEQRGGDRCERHGRRVVYWQRQRNAQQQGYCSDPDCFSRPRLAEMGRRLNWPPVEQEIPPNGRFPGWRRPLIQAGEAAWREFCAQAPYEAIDAALREVRQSGQELPLLAELFRIEERS